MKSVVAAVVLRFYVGSLLLLSVSGFPAETLLQKGSNQTAPTSQVELTEHPVFFDEAEQTSTESDPTTTENYMIIEDQVVDEDEDDSDSSTMSSAIFKSTLPMQPPKSSAEQDELKKSVLRELKKLWDYSEGLAGTEDDGDLKSSLSSILHLAYARYSELDDDDTLLKLKHLLLKLHARLLGTEGNADESLPTATTAGVSAPLLISAFTGNPTDEQPSARNATLSNGEDDESLSNQMTATAINPNVTGRRRKRSYYSGYDDIESLFYVNSGENAVIPASDDGENNDKKTSQSNHPNDSANFVVDSSQSEETTKDPLDRSLLAIGSVASSTEISISTSATTPLTPSQNNKVVHINDRHRPMSSLYLSPERIKELKSRVTASTTPPAPMTTSTLRPVSISIDDELENEVNSLQQQGQVDNYDVHMLVTPPLVDSTATTAEPTTSTSDPLATAEELALALFQLLLPDKVLGEDEVPTTTSLPNKSPPTVLDQLGSLSAAYNLTKQENATEPEVEASLDDVKAPLSQLYNNTLLVNPGLTDRNMSLHSQTSYVSELHPIKIFNATKDTLEQMVQTLTTLSTPAKVILLFALSISVLSIGIGLYSLGPPLVIVGVMGVLIPLGIILLFQTGGGKRKLSTRQKQALMDKLHSQEFAEILEFIRDAALKYGSS